MTTIKQLKSLIEEGEFSLKQAFKSGDEGTIDSVLSMLSRQRAQLAIVQEKLEEKGKIGYFPQNHHSLAVFERRKRSAVQVGERFLLPAIGQDKLACPNVIIRSTLFGLKSSQVVPETLNCVELACEAGASIMFSGPRLCQQDMLVWTTILSKLADDLSQTLNLSKYSLLRDVGLSDGTSSYAALTASLTRLNESSVTIQPKYGEIPITDCRMLTCAQSGSQVVCSVEPQWANLFGQARWSAIEKAKITTMKRKELAKWLAWFLQSHNGQVGLSVETIHSLCGSTSSLKVFRQNLKDAIEYCRSHGIIKLGSIHEATDCIKFRK